MNEIDQPITFRQILEKCPRIEVPLIQRDYAQGRETEKEVREHFLQALYGILVCSTEDSAPTLNLDFVYGSMENGSSGSFFPLDGQQRLTTLFLLHWYLAWRDGQHSSFKCMLWDGRHSRFTYGVRPSSAEFFDQLVCYTPDSTPDDVPFIRLLVEDQSWFFLHWRLDPTIQSVLVMLEAIHGLFKSTNGLFSRLTNVERPAITFQLLTLEHFGLTDLYIKMNARGKPLTPFETFKARFEELLKDLFPLEKRKLGSGEVSVAEFFERRIDTRWTDFFWSYKDQNTNTFDDLLMNLILALTRVSLNPESLDFSQDTTQLRALRTGGSFSLFHERGWLTEVFANNLINLLETWSRGGDKLLPALPDLQYFDEVALFQKAIQQPTSLDYTQLVQFGAFVFYLTHHKGTLDPGAMSEWMRVVRNLSVNTEIERPEEYGRCLSGLLKLVPHSGNILEYLSCADIGPIGFSPQQVREEVLKARLILSNPGWRDPIDRAEEHGYFCGQIEFLLDFCGIQVASEKTPEKWDLSTQTELQAAFDRYLKKAQITFTSSGLASTSPSAGEHLWKRALLTFGDYLLAIGSNFSFVSDTSTNGDSWKRFLRGEQSGKRKYLKALWDCIDADLEIEPQLNEIIANASDLEPWRAGTVRHPEVMSYCGQQQIRREWGSERIYLLNKRQMNGAHAELFSYVLSLELAGIQSDFAPLNLLTYESVYTADYEPRVRLLFQHLGHRVIFGIESVAASKFRIYCNLADLIKLPDVKIALCEDGIFIENSVVLSLQVARADIDNFLRRISNCLASLVSPTTDRG